MNEIFEKEKCDICGASFAGDGDIVVCPDCGTPYHRECYLKNGSCIHESEHGSYEWQGNIHSAETKELDGSKDNTDESTFEEVFEGQEAYGVHVFDIDSFNRQTERMLAEKPYFEPVDGVSCVELFRYVGKNGLYYLPVFRDIIKSGKMIKLNFAAFLFMPVHCFYRKMNLFGVMVMLITVLCSEVQLLAADFVAKAAISEPMGMFIRYVAGIVTLALNFFVLMFFNYWYLKSAIKKIKAIKRENEGESPEKIMELIGAAGKPALFYSIAYAVCVAIVMIIFIQLINNLAGISVNVFGIFG